MVVNLSNLFEYSELFGKICLLPKSKKIRLLKQPDYRSLFQEAHSIETEFFAGFCKPDLQNPMAVNIFLILYEKIEKTLAPKLEKEINSSHLYFLTEDFFSVLNPSSIKLAILSA